MSTSSLRPSAVSGPTLGNKNSDNDNDNDNHEHPHGDSETSSFAAANPSTCPTCQKTFSRIAHLRRHLASHEGIPRWTCDYCGSAFQRRDVLNRHLTTCGLAVSGARVDRRLTNRACDPCRDRKVRCNSGLPCTRCSDAGLECVYSLRKHRRDPKSSSAVTMSNLSPTTTISQQSDTLQLGELGLDVADTIHVASTTRHTTSSLHDGQGQSSTTNNGWHMELPEPCPDPGSVSEHEPGAAAFAMSGQPADETWMNVDALWSGNTDAFDLFQAFSWTMSQDSNQTPGVLVSSANRMTGMPTPNAEMQPLFVDPDPSSSSAPLEPWLVASGLGLAQLDPLTHHRSKITSYLEANCPGVPKILTLFRSQSLGMIINTYFRRHHRHTPIIHLPTWNIASCSTALVLSMSLITASYTPSLGLRASDIRPLLTTAYNFVVENDPNIQCNGSATVETLQALLLLVILERLMVPKEENIDPVIAFDEVIRLARRASLFHDTAAKSNNSSHERWRDWIVAESSRRLAFIFYALDCLLTVLSDGVPTISTYDMQLHLPRPEVLFEAATEAEWVRLRQTTSVDQSSLLSVLMELLLSGQLDQSLMPRTLMGKFAVIHGIFCYAWQAKRQHEMARSQGDHSGTATRLFESRVRDIRAALQLWRSTWLTTVSSSSEATIEECDNSAPPMLYKDRGMVWLYLAGVFTIPECKIVAASPPDYTRPNGTLSVCAFMQRMLAMLDGGQLENLGLDYANIHHLVTAGAREHTKHVSIGSLMYRESDAVEPGFR